MALFLRRKHGQSIVIGHCIRVTLVTHNNGTQSLAVNAPQELEVNTAEGEQKKYGNRRLLNYRLVKDTPQKPKPAKGIKRLLQTIGGRRV